MASLDKNVALSKMQQIVDAGNARVVAGMSALAKEYQLRRDVMVRPEALDVTYDAWRYDAEHEEPRREFRLIVPDARRPGTGKVEALSLTDHARVQFLARAGIPQTFADRLFDVGLPNLFRENVRWLLPKISTEGILVREVNGTAKGVLSSAYRRMDSSPIIETFIEKVMKHGLVPHQGLVTDTRAFVSFIWPEVVEITPGEYVVFGVELRSSDYGRGALEINLVIIRLRCLNGMTGMDVMRKVHLGRRFDFGDASSQVIEVSTKTHRLDSATVRSAVGDVVKALPAHQRVLQATLQARLIEGTGFSLANGLATLKKAGLKKEVVDKVKATYETQLPVEALPQEPGAWRFANVLSLLAKDAKGDESKDLEDVAFTAIIPARAA